MHSFFCHYFLVFHCCVAGVQKQIKMADADKTKQTTFWVIAVTTMLTDEAVTLKSEYPAVFSGVDLKAIVQSLSSAIATSCMLAYVLTTGEQSEHKWIKKKNHKGSNNFDKEIRKLMPILFSQVSSAADDRKDETERLFINLLNFKVGFLKLGAEFLVESKNRIIKHKLKSK